MSNTSTSTLTCYNVYYVNYLAYRPKVGIKDSGHQAELGYMLRKHPKGTPPLADMLASLGNPSAAEIATALGVSERTARQWKRQGTAPRPVLLALFWVTHWGQQWADADLFNRAMIDRGNAIALRRQVDELEKTIERLIKIADFGAANDPSTAHHRRSSRPAWTHQSRQNPQAEPVMPSADVQARHLATGAHPPSAPRNDTQLNPAAL